MTRSESFILPGELWRILQLRFRDPGPVAAKGWIIMELCPWNRMKISLEAQEATERSDRIQDVPADLLDDKPPDRPDPLTVGVINRGALNLVTPDQNVTRVDISLPREGGPGDTTYRPVASRGR